ncbi:MAG: class I SAM-dependent methyltransferase [Micrococcales bacterium]|nr:class I SAM-dependent methyltransferase [Micrococcales bacterium]
MTSHPGPDGPTVRARSDHWEDVHRGVAVDGVSWWQEVPTLSLGLVQGSGTSCDAAIIDVGGGWSTLVDHLVTRGYQDLTVVDLSPTAVRTVRDRLGPCGGRVRLEVGDVLSVDLGRRFGLWHDRAVFHFLLTESERDDYRAAVRRHLADRGHLVVATFGPHGPGTCSGLPVARYTPQELAAEFPGFDLVTSQSEEHVTPWGTGQEFSAVLLRRRPD